MAEQLPAQPMVELRHSHAVKLYAWGRPNWISHSHLVDLEGGGWACHQHDIEGTATGATSASFMSLAQAEARLPKPPETGKEPLP